MAAFKMPNILRGFGETNALSQYQRIFAQKIASLNLTENQVLYKNINTSVIWQNVTDYWMNNKTVAKLTEQFD